MNALNSMLSLAVKQDIDRRVETEAMRVLDELFDAETKKREKRRETSGGESENQHQLLDGRKSDADGKQRQPLGTNNNSNFMEQLFANTSSDSRVGNVAGSSILYDLDRRGGGLFGMAFSTRISLLPRIQRKPKPLPQTHSPIRRKHREGEEEEGGDEEEEPERKRRRQMEDGETEEDDEEEEGTLLDGHHSSREKRRLRVLGTSVCSSSSSRASSSSRSHSSSTCASTLTKQVQDISSASDDEDNDTTQATSTVASDEEERASEDESETDEAKSQMGRRKSLVEGMKENEKEQEEMHESASGDEQKIIEQLRVKTTAKLGLNAERPPMPSAADEHLVTLTGEEIQPNVLLSEEKLMAIEKQIEILPKAKRGRPSKRPPTPGCARFRIFVRTEKPEVKKPAKEIQIKQEVVQAQSELPPTVVAAAAIAVPQPKTIAEAESTEPEQKPQPLESEVVKKTPSPSKKKKKWPPFQPVDSYEEPPKVASELAIERLQGLQPISTRQWAKRSAEAERALLYACEKDKLALEEIAYLRMGFERLGQDGILNGNLELDLSSLREAQLLSPFLRPNLLVWVEPTAEPVESPKLLPSPWEDPKRPGRLYYFTDPELEGVVPNSTGCARTQGHYQRKKDRQKEQMLAEGIPRRTMMRRAAATAGGCAAEPHLLCTTISTQDETVARHKSQALKSERALFRSLAVSANSTAGNNGSNALVGDEAGNSAGLRANQLKSTHAQVPGRRSGIKQTPKGGGGRGRRG